MTTKPAIEALAEMILHQTYSARAADDAGYWHEMDYLGLFPGTREIGACLQGIALLENPNARILQERDYQSSIELGVASEAIFLVKDMHGNGFHLYADTAKFPVE